MVREGSDARYLYCLATVYWRQVKRGQCCVFIIFEQQGETSVSGGMSSLRLMSPLEM